jgi:hypothetical protein
VIEGSGVEVRDAGGYSLYYDDDGAGNLSFALRFVPPAASKYTLEISNLGGDFCPNTASFSTPSRAKASS